MTNKVSGNNTIATLERLKSMPGVFVQTIKQGGSVWFALSELFAILDGKADADALQAHSGDTAVHVTAAEKQAWDGKADRPLKGMLPPDTAPDYVGQEYLDAAQQKLYKAFGTASASDWVAIN